MKTVAVVLAGGVGSRMKADRPKQFLEISGKPIIVFTLENFQNTKAVDEVLVVCHPSWMDHMHDIVRDYKLEKVKYVIAGGDTCHDSTRNAVFFLDDKLASDDIVIIHDSARPLLPKPVIKDMLDVCVANGNASASIPCFETVIYTEDGKAGNKQLDRNSLMRVQTPQAYRFSILSEIYHKAEADNIHDFVYADLVAIHYGYTVYFSRGFTSNIKITNKEDIALFKALRTFSDEDLCPW